MDCELTLKDFKKKNIYSLGDAFYGSNMQEENISFTNYYMQKNGEPFLAVSGEFHYSRIAESIWKDELVKMKMCGINIVSTYVFWIHHEEEEGIFDFSGNRNLRQFTELCAELDLYVILRIGPFAHGEVRNGGLPDWLYGKPFEVRTTEEGFLYYTKQFYSKIAQEIAGLFYKDGGPIIAIQIDNEYMHSSAMWEVTAGSCEEWVFMGNEGNGYMMALKTLAEECGMYPVFYTCTGWGGAATPPSMIPLWDGYACRPWIVEEHNGKHPATEEYIYQDCHNNDAICTNSFQPCYHPEDKPYACCEMGGGMNCTYKYRFRFPYKGVDAMANIKLASGCNFLGYYMFHGGSNPRGKHGMYLNERKTPRISYDFQAPIGEFGQIRESYGRLKTIHYFVSFFGDRLCRMKTILPENGSYIRPEDVNTLRYAVRTDGYSGFLFINNYQDHVKMPDRSGDKIILHLKNENIIFETGIAREENAILPFHFDMDGIDLIQSTAQPVLALDSKTEKTYVFFVPEGMTANFLFEKGVMVNGTNTRIYMCRDTVTTESFTVEKESVRRKVLVISRRLAEQMYLIKGNRLIFTKDALLEDEEGLRIESTGRRNMLTIYPDEKTGEIGQYWFETKKKEISFTIKQTGPDRYTLMFPQNLMENVKEVLLQIDYIGDVGYAFIDGKLISDNFCNDSTWEIGLRSYAEDLIDHPMMIHIVPLKEDAKVRFESSIAVFDEEEEIHCVIKDIRLLPVYEIRI